MTGPPAVLGALRGAFDPHGPAARDIAELWWLLFAMGAAVFVVVTALLVVALRRGRAGDEAPDDAVPARDQRRWIVGGGVVMPAILLVVVLVATVDTMTDLPQAGADDAVRVEIIGYQWWWEVRYPDEGVVTANEIHIPVGRPVEFSLTSADVIHSFWVPELGGKLDLLPRDENLLVLQADRPATYRSQCAEFCGLDHALHRFTVVAEPAEEYAAWLAAQAEPAAEPQTASAREGRELFLGGKCVECHAIRGTSATGDKAPDLTHLASRQALTAALLPRTRPQLVDWIAHPQHFKEGTSMPEAELSAEQIEAVVDYLETLQ